MKVLSYNKYFMVWIKSNHGSFWLDNYSKNCDPDFYGGGHGAWYFRPMGASGIYNFVTFMELY